MKGKVMASTSNKSIKLTHSGFFCKNHSSALAQVSNLLLKETAQSAFFTLEKSFPKETKSSEKAYATMIAYLEKCSSLVYLRRARVRVCQAGVWARSESHVEMCAINHHSICFSAKCAYGSKDPLCNPFIKTVSIKCYTALYWTQGGFQFCKTLGFTLWCSQQRYTIFRYEYEMDRGETGQSEWILYKQAETNNWGQLVASALSTQQPGLNDEWVLGAVHIWRHHFGGRKNMLNDDILGSIAWGVSWWQTVMILVWGLLM